jgi:hypothetical protein
MLQMSAAAFIQGLLDLEGSSLTPILVSLVTKNASMLDAFGKVRQQCGYMLLVCTCMHASVRSHLACNSASRLC